MKSLQPRIPSLACGRSLFGAQPLRRLQFLFLIIVTVLATTFPGYAQFTETPVWADEFSYTGSPDPAKWWFQTGGGGWGNNELQHYTSRTNNARVENGILVINALREDYGGNQYTSARMNSQGGGNIIYGRVEVRARFTGADGTWPAIWMLASDWSIYGTWPACGEIDIMEHVSTHGESVQASIHTLDYNFQAGTAKVGFQYNVDYWNWHDYVLEWYPGRLDVSMDGMRYFSYEDEGTGYGAWPFDTPFNLILNVAVGGWGGDPTFTDETMEIDHVRIYEYTGESQFWVHPLAWYRIVNRNSGKVLDVDAAGLTEGTNLQQWDYAGADNQLWRFEPAGDGAYRLIARHSGLACDVSGASWDNGANVQQWTPNGTHAQDWWLQPVGSGYCKILSRETGRVLDVANIATTNGANVHQWDYTAGANQEWLIEEVIAAPPPPAPPAGLSAVAVSAVQVDLSWPASSGAAGYNVKWSPVSGGPYTVVTSVVPTAAYSDLGPHAGTTNYYVVCASDGYVESAPSVEASAVTPTPVAHLPFDETTGTVAVDANLNGLDGTLVNGPVWASGIIGNSVLLDGVDDYVSLPVGVAGYLVDYTISTWVYLNTVSTWSRVFDFGAGTEVNMYLTPENGVNGNVRYSITAGGGVSEQQIDGLGPLPTNAWTHVAITREGDTGTLYVNGTAVGTNSAMTLYPAALGDTTRNYIGKSQYADPYLDGAIDDFRIIGRALSASEIMDMVTPPENTPPVFTADPINQPNAVENSAYSASIAGSATDADAGDTLTYSKVSGPAWLNVAAGGALSGTPGAGDVGANSWTVQVSDGNGGTDTAGLDITVDADSGSGPVDDYANSDIIGSGSVSGSYADTLASDNGYQSITEIESGGKPSKRHSLLEHKWTVNVSGGNSVIFSVEAYKTANSEGDDFVFAYSTDNVNFTDMVTVTKTADDNAVQSYTLPNTLSGTVYIRVVDTDRSQGNNGLDTVYVDAMYIRSDGAPPPNQSPAFSSDPVVEANATEDAGYSSSIADNASDPEGDPMTFSKVAGPAWLSVAANGALSGTPGAGDVGLNSFTVQVDATGGSDTATLQITVDAAGTITDIYVSDITMSSATYGGNRISGIADITIRDDSGATVSGATVSVNWSGATSSSDSASTGGSGVVVFESGRKKNGGTYTVTVTGVSAAGYNYNPALNVETSDSITAQ